MASSKCRVLNRAQESNEPDLVLQRCHWVLVFCSRDGPLIRRADPQETAWQLSYTEVPFRVTLYSDI